MSKIVWEKRDPDWIKANPGKGTMYKIEIPDEAVSTIALRPLREKYKNLKEVEKLIDIGIYIVICEKAKTVYVGQSRSMGNRMRNHKMNITRSNNPKGIYVNMQKDYKHFGPDSFDYIRYIKLDRAYANDLTEVETETMWEFIEKGYRLYNRVIPGGNLSCPAEYKITLQMFISRLRINPNLIEKIKELLKGDKRENKNNGDVSEINLVD